MRRSASLAACLLAMLATAACTSSEGFAPPAEVGSSGPSASGSAMSASSNLAAPSTSLAPTTTGPAPAAPAAASAAPLGAEAAPAFSGPEPSASATVPQGDGGPVAAAISPSRIQFAPITGTTREAAAPLSQRLAARARERGIGLAGNGSPPTYVLKGYFSEISEGGATTVIYVWDVLDPAGNRLHRIQGQAKAGGLGGWSAVSTKTMQSIADRTIDELASWLSTRAS